MNNKHKKEIQGVKLWITFYKNSLANNQYDLIGIKFNKYNKPISLWTK